MAASDSSPIGKKFGRWTVIARDYGRHWQCRCECGEERIVAATSLFYGRSKSCGCLRDELTSARRFKHGCSGEGITAEYRAWKGMHKRCTNPRCGDFYLYGGRGIRVCERWRSFLNFLQDMGSRPGKSFTLDRINPNGDYTPSNTRWARGKQQARNRRGMRYLQLGGRRMLLCEWAELLGIKQQTIAARLTRGWTAKQALTKAVRGFKNARMHKKA